MHPQIAGLPCS